MMSLFTPGGNYSDLNNYVLIVFEQLGRKTIRLLMLDMTGSGLIDDDRIHTHQRQSGLKPYQELRKRGYECDGLQAIGMHTTVTK